MKLHSETGSVLSLVLIFLLAISWLAVHVATHSLMMFDMSRKFQHQMNENILAEELLQKKEQNLHLKSGSTETVFLPDDLSFGSASGVYISKVQAQPYASSVVLRKPETTVNHLINKVILKPKMISLSELEFLSMVWVEAPCAKHPTQAFPGFLAFQQQHKNRKTRLYAIAKQKADNICKLYCFDGNTGDELETILLKTSFKEAKLLVEDLYYDSNWHTLLILAGTTEAQDSPQSSMHINVFDISQLDNALKDLASIFNKTVALEAYPSSLKTLRLAKDWLIGLAGSDNGIGTIQLMSLKLSPSILLTTRERGKILNWVAADTQSKGQVDKIYAVDDQGNLWAWMVTEQGFTHDPIKLLTQKINPLQTTLIAVPCLNSAGVELFYFSKAAAGKDKLESVFDLSQQGIDIEGVKSHQIFELNLELNPGTKNKAINEAKNEVSTVGNFQTAYSRFGRIVLVPKYSKDLPRVLSRTRQGVELLDCVWKVRTQENHKNDKKDNHEARISEAIIQSALIWDSKLQREVLWMLESNNNVMMLDSNFNNDKLGRMSWRNF